MNDNNDKKNGYHSENGKFIQGNPGRPSGIKNKTRKSIKDFVESQVENLPAWFATLANDRERLEYFIRLLSYALPRLQGIVETDSDGESTNEFNLEAWSDEDLRLLFALQKKYDVSENEN